ncbi:DAO domain-containing protein [Durusdinium trenchii]|uniref:DAO domain-containing protein n=1 Tax=Durusdinium trenchii TaxID=1381693 RepID=A0ABP0Q6G0_9DINO
MKRSTGAKNKVLAKMKAKLVKIGLSDLSTVASSSGLGSGTGSSSLSDEKMHRVMDQLKALKIAFESKGNPEATDSGPVDKTSPVEKVLKRAKERRLREEQRRVEKTHTAAATLAHSKTGGDTSAKVPDHVCEDEGEENPKTTKLTMKISGDTSSKKRGTSSDWNYGEIRKDGLKGAAIDIDHNPRIFDLTTSAWSGRFWMGVFQSPSPKPHVVYSNDEALIGSIVERAGYMSREDQRACPVRTTKTYIDKHGVKRAVGKKKEMRESQ